MPDVMNIQETVAYQKGAIVSKTLVEKEGGTVTLFAFDRDQALSEHTAPFDALVHVTDGEAEIRIAGVPHRVVAGEMIVMPAGHPHALKALTAFKMMLIMVRAGDRKKGASKEDRHDRN
ncbi:MAG TPA: cupin domain-containing protein [Candidatus Aminicenantes bacterium]|nr:cupin domain-containing protein [Candidatus Aminicenantes bacterium]